MWKQMHLYEMRPSFLAIVECADNKITQKLSMEIKFGGLDLESHSKLKWKTTLQADPTLI